MNNTISTDQLEEAETYQLKRIAHGSLLNWNMAYELYIPIPTNVVHTPLSFLNGKFQYLYFSVRFLLPLAMLLAHSSTTQSNLYTSQTLNISMMWNTMLRYYVLVVSVEHNKY